MTLAELYEEIRGGTNNHMGSTPPIWSYFRDCQDRLFNQDSDRVGFTRWREDAVFTSESLDGPSLASSAMIHYAYHPSFGMAAVAVPLGSGTAMPWRVTSEHHSNNITELRARHTQKMIDREFSMSIDNARDPFQPSPTPRGDRPRGTSQAYRFDIRDGHPYVSVADNPEPTFDEEY